jgi:hypothetical protein
VAEPPESGSVRRVRACGRRRTAAAVWREGRAEAFNLCAAEGRGSPGAVGVYLHRYLKQKTR